PRVGGSIPPQATIRSMSTRRTVARCEICANTAGSFQGDWAQTQWDVSAAVLIIVVRRALSGSDRSALGRSGAFPTRQPDAAAVHDVAVSCGSATIRWNPTESPAKTKRSSTPALAFVLSAS